MSSPKSKKTKSNSQRAQVTPSNFFANYITVFFVLAGTVAIGSSASSYIQDLFPDNCMNATGFNCLFGSFEIANVVGVLLFIVAGYWLLCKCLHIASFKRLVLGALVTILLLYLGDRYIFQQMQTATDLPHGLYFHVQWSRELIAILIGAAAVFVPFHLKSK